MALVVSGGHTELVYMPEDGEFQLSEKQEMMLQGKLTIRLVVF